MCYGDDLDDKKRRDVWKAWAVWLEQTAQDIRKIVESSEREASGE